MTDIHKLLNEMWSAAHMWIVGIARGAWKSLAPYIPSAVALATLVLIGVVVCIIVRVRRDRGFHDTTMHTVDTMNGVEFERFLVDLFRHMGYRVQHVGGSHDFGADLVLLSHRQRIVVQAKRYTGNVGIGAVQELLGAMHYYGGTRGIVVTSGGYTESARRLAACSSVELWGRSRLAAAVDNVARHRNHGRAEPVYNELKG